jgi:sulfoxide reductase heme-binding subunit YedZ
MGMRRRSGRSTPAWTCRSISEHVADTALAAERWSAAVPALAKPLAFGLMTLPFASLVWAAFADQLGANPAEALIRSSGDWTLRSLCLVLALTPLRVWTGVAALARFRRMVGLFVFFYASLHGLAYAWFDMGFVWIDVAADLAKRPFILVGFTGLCLLFLLAISSNQWAITRMGGKLWNNMAKL